VQRRRPQDALDPRAKACRAPGCMSAARRTAWRSTRPPRRRKICCAARGVRRKRKTAAHQSARGFGRGERARPRQAHGGFTRKIRQARGRSPLSAAH
jgi:hypothetical protein